MQTVFRCFVALGLTGCVVLSVVQVSTIYHLHHTSKHSSNSGFPQYDPLTDFQSYDMSVGRTKYRFHTLSTEHPLGKTTDDSTTRVQEPRVYWTIFAGRRKPLDLQKKYILEAIEQKIVDEVHIWDFTCKNAKDEQERKADHYYIYDELATLSPQIYVVSMPTESNGNKKKCEWDDYYAFYAQMLQDDDVLLKVDDDVIFVDTSPDSKRLTNFISAIRSLPQVFLWSANVINNGKSAVYQTKAQSLQSVSIHEKDEALFWGKGNLFQNAKAAYAIHEEFLSNMSKFFYPPNGDSMLFFQQISTRFSINFFGMLGKHASKAYEYIQEKHSRKKDDEFSLTTLAYFKYGEILMMYAPLVASHASFGPQNEIRDEVYSLYRKQFGDVSEDDGLDSSRSYIRQTSWDLAQDNNFFQREFGKLNIVKPKKEQKREFLKYLQQK